MEIKGTRAVKGGGEKWGKREILTVYNNSTW
jgi:hypothetical protein